MASRRLTVDLVGNNRNLHRTLDSTESRMGRFQGRARSFGVGVAAGIGAAFAVDKILGFTQTLSSLGTSVEVAGIKTDTVFGDSADGVREWADDINEALGISDEALTGLAANMGDLLKPMGFTAEQAADMSTEMLDLSGALSAWSGGTRSAADVAEILQSALLGERESLKGLGISITEADVQQRLMEKGQQDLTGAALAQAEALATQELLFEKSTDAQEAWNDGSMDGVKAQNELRAAWADAQVFLAQHFLPILRELFDYGKNVIDFARVLKLAWDINGFQGVIDVLGHWFENVLKPKLEGWFDDIKTWVTDTGLPKLKEGLVTLGEGVWDWLTNEETGAIAAVGDKMGEMFDALKEWVRTDGLDRMNDAVAGFADSFWSWMNDDEHGASAMIDSSLSDFIDEIGSWFNGEGKDDTEEAGKSFAGSLVRAWGEALFLETKYYLYEWPMFILRKLTEGLSALGGWLVDLGARMGNSIIDGIKESFSNFSFDDLFDIHGPSIEDHPFNITDWFDRSGGRSSGRRGTPRFASRSFTTADMAASASFVPTAGTTIVIEEGAVQILGMASAADIPAVQRGVVAAIEGHIRRGGSIDGLG